MKPVRAILFDLDGTLIDSVRDIAASVNWVLTGLGLPAKSVEEVAGFVGDGVQELLRRAIEAGAGVVPDKSATEPALRVGEGVPEPRGEGAIGGDEPAVLHDAVKRFRAHYLGHCLDTTRLYPTVQETLAHFRAKRLAVVTNKPYPATMRILDGLHVTGYFPVVLGGESAARRKPHPAPVLKALELLEVSAAEAVMVGDSPHDVAAGREAGLLTCGVTYGLTPRGVLRAARPDHMLTALRELSDWVR